MSTITTILALSLSAAVPGEDPFAADTQREAYDVDDNVAARPLLTPRGLVHASLFGAYAQVDDAIDAGFTGAQLRVGLLSFLALGLDVGAAFYLGESDLTVQPSVSVGIDGERWGTALTFGGGLIGGSAGFDVHLAAQWRALDSLTLQLAGGGGASDGAKPWLDASVAVVWAPGAFFVDLTATTDAVNEQSVALSPGYVFDLGQTTLDVAGSFGVGSNSDGVLLVQAIGWITMRTAAF